MKTIYVKINRKYIPEYCLITKIVRGNDGAKRVIKTPWDDRARNHVMDMHRASEALPQVLPAMEVCPCEISGGDAVFPFVAGKSCMEAIQDAARDSLDSYVAAWRGFLDLITPGGAVPFSSTERFEELFGSPDDFADAPSYACCAVDLTPSNVLVPEGSRPVLIDYEWWVPGPVPAELIQYHAVATPWLFHPELHREDIELDALLKACGFRDDAIGKCRKAMDHFYRHIGGNDLAEKPYYLNLQRYEKPKTSVRESIVENSYLKGLNEQMQRQCADDARVLNDMLAGWRESSRGLENLQKALQEVEAKHAAERERLNALLDDANRRMEACNARLDDANRRAEDANHRAEACNARLEAADRQAKAREARLEETEQRLEASNARLEEATEANRALRASEAEINGKLEKVNKAYAELIRNHEYCVSEWTTTARKYTDAEQQLQSLLVSRSWKLTRPLREGKLTVKRFIGRSAQKGYYFIKRRRERGAVAPAQGADVHVRPQNWPPKGAANAVGSCGPLPKQPRRLAIYFFYDRGGRVDRYVTCFLEALMRHVERIVFVSNGSLDSESEKRVRALTGDVVIRENRGFDSGALKAGLSYVGRDAAARYDEVLLLNYTFYGPIQPLETVFEGMAKRSVDFWGIVSHPGFDFDPFGCCPYGKLPAHIQSYWIAVRKRLLESEAFWAFWDQLPEVHDYNEAIGYFEAVFTRYFADLGYQWATWIDPGAYEGMTDNPLIDTPIEIMRDAACPIVKRRAFFQDYDYLTTYTGQHTASFLMDYIQNELDYPAEYIWENLIRTVHMSTLAQNMHLIEILDKYNLQGPPVKKYVAKHPVALFMHIYDVSMAGELAGYAGNLPDGADIWISTTSEEKKNAIAAAFGGLKQKVSIRVCPNRGRDVSALLASFNDVVMNYELICVTHDKKTAYLKPETVGEGFAYMGYENILASREYVTNIIRTFAGKPFLGMLYSPDPNHADFATHIGMEWGGNYAACKALAEELKLNVPMDEKHPACAPYGSNFWIRTDALKPLYNKKWTYEDFPAEPVKETDGTIMHAIERIYPYCAQQAGYYSAMVMTTEYSAVELDNLEFYAMTYAHVCFENGIANRYIAVRDMLDARLGVAVAPVDPTAGAGTPAAPAGRLGRLKVKVRDKLKTWASL